MHEGTDAGDGTAWFEPVTGEQYERADRTSEPHDP